MENLNEKYTHIKGWGVDANDDNEPTYPIKKYNGDDHLRLNYERPVQQPLTVEVLHSNERPGVSSVFGAAVPPSGLSGAIRRYAFKYSEGSFAHWLPLLLADRVNVVEGIVQDLRSGIVPDIFAEKGWNAEWKHNRKGAVKKIVVTAVIALAAIALLTRKKKKYR